MVSTPDVAATSTPLPRLIDEAARGGAKLVALPEYFCLLGRRDTDKLAIAEADGDGPIQELLADSARARRRVAGRRHAAAAHGDAERVRNSCCVYAPDGQRCRALRQDPPVRLRQRHASATTKAACSRPATRRWRSRPAALRIGLSVCYDLRFPELYRALCTPPCDLICVPSSFTYTTGRRTGSCCCARARSRTSAT